MHIDDKETVDLLVKLLHDTNQHIKTVYGSGQYYHYQNGTIVCNNSGQVTPYITAHPVYTKKNNHLSQYINNAMFSIDGTAFFQFHKEYKKNITEIIIDDKFIQFKTNLPLVELVFPNLSTSAKQFDLHSSLEHLATFTFSSEQVNQMIESKNNPFTIYMDFEYDRVIIDEKPEDNFLQLVFNKKFLTGLKATVKQTSEVTIHIYDYNSDKSLYLLAIMVKWKDIEVAHYLVITDVVDEEESNEMTIS
jgi:hypothetical protein